MLFQVKRYIDGTPAKEKTESLPQIKNSSVLNIIDHAIERNNRLLIQSAASQTGVHSK